MSTDSPDILRGNYWVMGPAHVLVWSPPKFAKRAPTIVPEPQPPIGCTACGAKPQESCRTPKGGYSIPHTARTSPRLCECGEALGYKRTYCDACRDARHREIGRKSTARRAKALREASQTNTTNQEETTNVA